MKKEFFVIEQEDGHAVEEVITTDSGRVTKDIVVSQLRLRAAHNIAADLNKNVELDGDGSFNKLQRGSENLGKYCG